MATQQTESASSTEKAQKTKNLKLRRSIFNMLEAGEDPGFVRFVHGKVADLDEVEADINDFRRLVTGNDAKPTQNDVDMKVKEKLGTGDMLKQYYMARDVISGLKEYRDLYDKVSKDNTLSPTEFAGKDAAVLKSKHKALMFNIAQAEGTGALQEADKKLVEELLPDVSTANPADISGQLLRGGREGNLAAMNDVIEQMKQRVSRLSGLDPSEYDVDNQSPAQADQKMMARSFTGDQDSFAQAMAFAQSNPDDERSKKFLSAVESGRIDKTTGKISSLSPGQMTPTGLSTLTPNVVDPETDEVKMGGFFQPWATPNENDTAMQAGLKTAANVIPSALNFGKGVIDFLNPLTAVETAQGIGEQAGQALGSGEMSGSELISETAKGIPGALKEVLLPQFLKDIFKGDTRSAAMAIESDPVGQIAPLLLVARGAAQKAGQGAQFDAAISKIASPVTKTGEALGSGVKTMVTKPTKFAVSQATGISPDTISRIVADPQAFSQEARTSISREGVAREIESALGGRIKDLSETGQKYQPIRGSQTLIKVKPTFLEDAIKKTTGLEMVDGQFVSNTKSSFRDAADVRAVNKLYNDWNGLFQEGQMSPHEFLNLRSDLAGLAKFERQVGKSAPIEAATQRIRGELNSTYRDQIEGLSELDRSNFTQKGELDVLRKGLVDKDGNLTSAAINKIANSTGKGKDILAQQLEEIVPGITDKVKLLKAFEDIEAATGQKVGTYTRAGAGVIGLSTMNVPLMVASIMAIPEIAVPLLRGAGIAAEKVGPILKTLGVPLEKLNQSPEAIPKLEPSKEPIPAGMSINDVSGGKAGYSNIPKKVTIDEMRQKYPNASAEFWKEESIRLTNENNRVSRNNALKDTKQVYEKPPKKGEGAIPQIASNGEEMITVFHASPNFPKSGKWRKGTYFAPDEQSARFYAESHHRGNIDVQRVTLPKSALFKQPSNGNYILNKEHPITSFERAKNLSPADRAIEDAAFARISQNERGILDDYIASKGKVVNADDFRPYFKEDGYTGGNAVAVQEPSSYLAKKAFAEGLKRPGKYAIFTSGQSGAGKTSALKNIKSYAAMESDAAVVLDSNLSNMDSAMKKVAQAEKAGKVPIFFYVYREPVEALVKGVVKRMRDNPDEMGRIVPNVVSAQNGPGSWEVAKKLHEDGYLVKFIDNSLGDPKKAKSLSFEEVSKKIKFPENLKQVFDREVKKLYEQGQIDQREYEAYIAE